MFIEKETTVHKSIPITSFSWCIDKRVINAILITVNLKCYNTIFHCVRAFRIKLSHRGNRLVCQVTITVITNHSDLFSRR